MPQLAVLLLARADNSPVDTPFDTAVLDANDPFSPSRHTAYIAEDGIAAGIVHARGSVSVEHYPFTEMLVVHQGVVTLSSAGRSVDLEPGQSAVIGRGTALRIDVQGAGLWAFCAATQASGPDKPGVTLIDRSAPLEPSAAPEPSILIGPTPQCRSNNLFEDTASTLRIGVWDSTPYQRGARPHKVHEMMHLIEGEVELRLDDGPSVHVKPGDTVFVPQGMPCAWKSEMYVRKFYVVN